MTDNLDMDEHHILSVKNLTDHKVGDFFFFNHFKIQALFTT